MTLSKTLNSNSIYRRDIRRDNKVSVNSSISIKFIFIAIIYLAIFIMYIILLEKDDFLHIEYPLNNLANAVFNKNIENEIRNKLDITQRLRDIIPQNVIELPNFEQIITQTFNELDIVIEQVITNLINEFKNTNLILKIGLKKSCVLLSKEIDVDTIFKPLVEHRVSELFGTQDDINNKLVNPIKDFLNTITNIFKCYIYEELDAVGLDNFIGNLNNKVKFQNTNVNVNTNTELVGSKDNKLAKTIAGYINIILLATTISIATLTALIVIRIFYKNSWLRLLYRFVSIIIMIFLIILTGIFLAIPNIPLNDYNDRLSNNGIDLFDGYILKTKFWGLSLKLLVSCTSLLLFVKLLPVRL